METSSPTEAENKLTDEQRANGVRAMDPRWGYLVKFDDLNIIQPPSFSFEVIYDLRNRLQLKSHDIIVATFPKCGTTWMQQIVLLLMKGSEAEVFPQKDGPWIEMTASRAVQPGGGNNTHGMELLTVDQMLELPPPGAESSGKRLWKTHSPLRGAPWKGGVKGANKAGAKIIIVSRNPKDAAISKYHHTKRQPNLSFDGEWDDFVPLYLNEKTVYGSHWDWHCDWWQAKAEYPDTILWLQYEDMKKDLKGAVKSVAEFLDLQRTDEEIEKITDRCTFNSMKAEDDKRSGGDPKKSHLRSGKAGGWTDKFSEEMSSAFDERTERMYAETTFRFLGM